MKSLKNLQAKNWNIELNKTLYDAQITRNNPTAILFMIDQSQSMAFDEHKQIYKGKEKTFAQIVADMINELLSELIGRCTKAEGIRDYFDVCVLGYGGSSNSVNTLWEGNLSGKDWVSISELKSNAKYDKRTETKTIRGKKKTSEVNIPYWFQPVANYQTPMGAAFEKAYMLLQEWILAKSNKDSYPPVVINITDGMQSDYDNQQMIDIAKKIQSLNTKDGHVLVLNCHISIKNDSVIFPRTIDELPEDNYAKRLYEMSSIMPEIFASEISQFRKDNEVFSNYRGMAFNSNIDMMFNLIDIGTSGATQHLSKL